MSISPRAVLDLSSRHIRREDDLTLLDCEIEKFGNLLHIAIDGDTSLRRVSDNGAEVQSILLNIGVAFEVAAGESLEDEILWMVECLAGAIGRKVVAR